MDVPQAEQNAFGVLVVAIQPGSRRHLRGRRGGLKDMPDMPLDILFEICRFLHPRDLLNLARTSKAFRALLMRRDSAIFWRQVRRQFEGLPDPPSYLSEPAYANLLFFPHCHNCLKPNIPNMVCMFSARFCRACLRSLFTLSTAEADNLMWRMTNVEGKPFQMADLVYSEKIIRKHKERIFRPEIATMGVEWAALKDYQEREKYIHKRRVFVAECQEFSERLAGWKETYDATKSSDLNDLKEERLRAVKEILYDEGWGHIMDNRDWSPAVQKELTDLKTVNKASRLTEKGWKNMRASVIEVMERLQREFIRDRLTRVCAARRAWIRMEDERLFHMYHARVAYLKGALETYRSQNTPRTAASDGEPGFAEFANMPSFRNLIVQDESNDVVLEALRSLLADIPNLIAQWIHTNAQMFAHKALEALGDSFQGLAENPADLLDLAIVSFVCTRCGRALLRWPGILAHNCLWAKRIPNAHTNKYEHAVVHNTQRPQDNPFWGREFTVFDRHIHITRAVVSACGLDPNTATFDEVEGRGARFVSGVVSTGWQQIDDWQAVRRYFMSRPECAHAAATVNVAERFALVSEDMAVVAREQERWTSSNSLSGPDKVFGCALCIGFGQYPAILSHLRIKHHVWNAEVELMGQYMYLHEDSKMQGAPRVWLPQ
ncbi:hypothetical protein LXA43DRAFT_730878 [Ganoderma leucocontextum]|nr:hypothetical protein LXA43DRAFT_730878 [Ganoderma leucocontextum]